MQSDSLFDRLLDELRTPRREQASSYQVKKCSPREIVIESAGRVTIATLKKSAVKKGLLLHDHEILIRTRGSDIRIRLTPHRLMRYAFAAPLSIMTQLADRRLELMTRIPTFFRDEQEREAAVGLAKAALLHQGIWLDLVESDFGIRGSGSGVGRPAASIDQDLVFRGLERELGRAGFRAVVRDGPSIEARPPIRTLASGLGAIAYIATFPVPALELSPIRCEVVIPLYDEPRSGLMKLLRWRTEEETFRRTTRMQIAGWSVGRNMIEYGTCVPSEATDTEKLMMVLDTLMERIDGMGSLGLFLGNKDARR